MMQLKSIDLFAGIGGIRLGFEQAFGSLFTTVFVSEVNKFAKQTYQANFNADLEIAGDITTIDAKNIDDFDVALAGFPCQAGKRAGFNDDYKGVCRGTLFFDVARICEYHQPKVIFCENVKGLLSHDKGNTFKVICNTLTNIGYKVFYQTLNSKDFGVAQNRQRVYIVAFRDDIAPLFFDFPTPIASPTSVSAILQERVDDKYYLSDKYLNYLKKKKVYHQAKGNGFGYAVLNPLATANTLTCSSGGRECNLVKDDSNVVHHKNKENIRFLTPRECARLQGFPESFNFPVSDTQAYKQLGNTVTVPVIAAIAQQIKLTLSTCA